ncbi:hypothetical protein Q31a_01110 [Aureliella helgolandensis]|uniref:Uncharacterized protein n=1 Tax=Aureliella helgolandensis TaxID=2527968 RepID=A0A518FZP8_9BACT|nr:hypothetical protein Q31a_01110 [Aureliella helgolandensis]
MVGPTDFEQLQYRNPTAGKLLELARFDTIRLTWQNFEFFPSPRRGGLRGR